MAQIFPKWSNAIPKIAPPLLLLGAGCVVFVVYYWFSPEHTDVGYQPNQPVAYSHQLHAGKLGIDCRYCHFGVEKSSVAGVPPTQICLNCHRSVLPDSMKLAAVMKSWKNDTPIPWVRVHKLPDYVYFDHSVHVNVGVGCISCHGRVDSMEKMRLEKPLSMTWCLDCHRNPAPHLKPLDKITAMDWIPPKGWDLEAKKLAANMHAPIISCSGCHR